MKKLTAGIFATILGLTAVDAFAAAAGTPVASTNYVQGAIQSLDAAKVGTSDATSYIKNVSETDGKISAEAGTLAKVATTGAYSDLTGIPTDIVTDADLALKADKTELKDWVLTTTYTEGQAAQDAKITALEEANAALGDTYATDQELTDGLATKADKTELKDWVLTETYTAGQAAQDAEINTAKTNASNAVNAATAAADLAAEVKTTADEAATTAGNAKTAADEAKELAAGAEATANQAAQDAATAKSDAATAKTDAASAKSTAEANAADIVTIKAEQTTQNNAIDALEAAAGNYVKWTDVVDSYTE